MKFNQREEIIELTPKWKGERFSRRSAESAGQILKGAL